MIKLYKFRKILDQYTTHSFVNNSDEETKATELCTIGDDTYISVPDEMTIPDQPECINLEEVTLTDELKASIKAASPHVSSSTSELWIKSGNSIRLKMKSK